MTLIPRLTLPRFDPVPTGFDRAALQTRSCTGQITSSLLAEPARTKTTRSLLPALCLAATSAAALEVPVTPGPILQPTVLLAEFDGVHEPGAWDVHQHPTGFAHSVECLGLRMTNRTGRTKIRIALAGSPANRTGAIVPAFTRRQEYRPR
jgi:hypothetical protein